MLGQMIAIINYTVTCVSARHTFRLLIFEGETFRTFKSHSEDWQKRDKKFFPEN